MTNEELFRKHWKWLAETGNQLMDWPRFVFNGGTISTPLDYCFACEEARTARREVEGRSLCTECPIVWTTESVQGEESLLTSPCLYRGSPYAKWCAADTNSEKEFFAKIIAKMPWHLDESVEICCGVKIILHIQRAGQAPPAESDLVQVRGTILLPTNKGDNHLMWELRFDERIPAIMEEFLTATWGTYNEDFGFRESDPDLYTGKTWKVAVDAARNGLQKHIEPLKAAIKKRHQALIDTD